MEPCIGFEMNIMGMFMVCQRDYEYLRYGLRTATPSLRQLLTTPNQIASLEIDSREFLLLSLSFLTFHIGATEDCKALGMASGNQAVKLSRLGYRYPV
jgi:hypothetical protein